MVRGHARPAAGGGADRSRRDWGAGAIVRDEVDLGARIAAERLGAQRLRARDRGGSFLCTEIATNGWRAAGAARAGRAPPHETVLSPFPPRCARRRGPSRSGRGTPGGLGDAVYLTLGTVFNAESGDLLARALAGVRELGLPVVVTTGRQIDPAELGPQPPSVRVQRWIPHEELLPWCRAIVSHGGSGTALGALAHGLPSVLLPIGADQPQTAARLAELGAALGSIPSTATSGEIADAARRVLDDPLLRRRGSARAEEIRAPGADLQSSTCWIRKICTPGQGAPCVLGSPAGPRRPIWATPTSTGRSVHAKRSSSSRVSSHGGPVARAVAGVDPRDDDQVRRARPSRRSRRSPATAATRAAPAR